MSVSIAPHLRLNVFQEISDFSFRVKILPETPGMLCLEQTDMPKGLTRLRTGQ